MTSKQTKGAQRRPSFISVGFYLVLVVRHVRYAFIPAGATVAALVTLGLYRTGMANGRVKFVHRTGVREALRRPTVYHWRANSYYEILRKFERFQSIESTRYGQLPRWQSVFHGGCS